MTIRYSNNSFWVVMVSNITRGSILPDVLPVALLSALIGLCTSFWHIVWNSGSTDSPLFPERAHKMLIVPLSFLLIFRSTISYSRFWEGRTHISNLVRATTELIRQTCSYIRQDVEDGIADRKSIRALLIITLRVTQLELSDEKTDAANLEKWCSSELDVAASSIQRPDVLNVKALVPVLVTKISLILSKARADRLIRSSRQLSDMDSNLQLVISSWLACRKIKDTPMPFPYVQMLSFFLIVFVLTLPFAIVHMFMWTTPAIAAVVTTALFGINAIGVEIEDPFGTDANDFEFSAIIDEVATDTENLLSMAGNAHIDYVNSEASQSPRSSDISLD